MLPSVYMDTSVLSYLTARPSRDLVAAGRQQVTRDWWRMAPRHFALVASSLVVNEARAGNPQTAPAHEVKETLGHASLATTSRYTHARPGGTSSATYLRV